MSGSFLSYLSHAGGPRITRFSFEKLGLHQENVMFTVETDWGAGFKCAFPAHQVADFIKGGPSHSLEAQAWSLLNFLLLGAPQHMQYKDPQLPEGHELVILVGGPLLGSLVMVQQGIYAYRSIIAQSVTSLPSQEGLLSSKDLSCITEYFSYEVMVCAPDAEYIARAMFHPSVPEDERVGLLMDTLTEFPLARMLEGYSEFYRVSLALGHVK